MAEISIFDYQQMKVPLFNGIITETWVQQYLLEDQSLYQNLMI